MWTDGTAVDFEVEPENANTPDGECAIYSDSGPPLSVPCSADWQMVCAVLLPTP